MNIPQRFSEAAFRRYEAIITQAVAVLPSRFTFHPHDLSLSAETVAQRLRDAMRSLSTYRWNTTVNMVKFDKAYGTLQVKREGDELVIARRGEDKQAALSATSPDLIEITNPTKIELLGLASLLARRALPGVSLTGISLDLVEAITAPYDVGVVEKDGKIILL